MKIFGLPVGADGCGYHRCYQPLAELRRRGHNVMLPERGMVWLPDAELNAGQIDVFAGQLLTGPRGMGLWESWRGKTALVYDIDDDVFNSDHEGSLWHKMPECRDIAAYLLAISDLVTVSTEPLADVVKRYNPNVAVLPNCVHEDLLKISRPRRERVTVGWAGGTSHLRDFQYVAPMLARFLARNPAVDMHFVGADYTPLLKVPDGRTRHTRWEPDVWDYYAGIDFDIGIAPLDPLSAFAKGKCIDSSMRISTNQGVLEAGSIKPDMKVWLNGWREVQAVEHQAERAGLRITTSRGLQVAVTPEHRLMDGGGSWQHARDLKAGDVLQIVREECPQLEYQRAPWPPDGRVTRAGEPEPMGFLDATEGPAVTITETWGRILGLFTGDGSMTGKTAVRFSCDGQDADLIKNLIADLESTGLKATTEQVTTYGGQVLRRRSVRVSSAHLSRFLAGVGAAQPHSVTGQRWERTLRVPDVIFRSPQSVRAAFLAGLFEADAYVAPSAVALTTKSEDLARDVQRLMWSIGVPSVIGRNKGPKGSPYANRTYWAVRTRLEETKLFAAEIGFLSQRKRGKLADVIRNDQERGQRLNRRGDHRGGYRGRRLCWTDKIAAVEPCAVSPVDIQVEGEAFSAAGVLSHNSHLKAMEYGALGIPVVASDSEPYRWYVQHGVTGFLVRYEHEWGRYLRQLVNDAAMRAEMGAAAKRLAAEWTIQRRYTAWESAFREVMERVPVP